MTEYVMVVSAIAVAVLGVYRLFGAGVAALVAAANSAM
jgi:hypothetical protein